MAMKAKNKASNNPAHTDKGNGNSRKYTGKPVMDKRKDLFWSFVLKKGNRIFIYYAFAIGIVYFITLRILFPIPSFYSDSYTYIQVARDNQSVSFRPVQYAEIINFFKGFSTSDVALIAGQFFSNLLANLLLFFTFTWLFTFNRVYKIILFIALICNPLYLFYSNYILTDSFFSAFTVLWFTLLVWMIYKPAWYFTVLQLFVLAILFKLRYNAIIFPVFTALALFLSDQILWKKLLAISAGFILILLLVTRTIQKTEDYTGTRTFSAFSGWQMANNALHILRYQRIDTTDIDDEETKNIISFSKKYFDTTKLLFDSTNVTAEYMWNKKSPLKVYMNTYAAKNFNTSYLDTWTALGPVYNNFGKTIIFKKPFSYLRYFVLPNAKQYFFPQLEAYNAYCENADTISPIAKVFFGYKTNKAGPKHTMIYTFVFKPWPYIFPALNVFFLAAAFVYLVTRKYKKESLLFNKVLLCFSAFYLANFLFVVLLAPTVFRYHIFIITLLFPITLLLLQKLIRFDQSGSIKKQ